MLNQTTSGQWPKKQVTTDEKILNIKKESLTREKYNALLTITTGDSDIYAFGAENRYHAVKYQNDWTGFMKEHAIVSDAGVGESTWGWAYEYQFREAAIIRSRKRDTKHGRQSKRKKWITAAALCIVCAVIWSGQKIIEYRNSVKRMMENREDNLAYLGKTDGYGYDVEEKEEKGERFYDLIISYRVYSNGSFVKTENKDFGPARHYKISKDKETYRKEEYFQTRPVSGRFNKEFCQKNGIEIANFNVDLEWQEKHNAYWNITLWDDYVLLFDTEWLDGYIGRIFNKQGIEQELITETEYDIGCDRIHGAEFVNQPMYFYDQEKEELHIFYKNEYGIFLRILTAKEQ